MLHRLAASALAPVSLLTLAATNGAAAQTAGPATTQVVSGPAEIATTSASDAVEHRDELPDVIVTARRRAEDAQAVPGSLSVVGGQLLDRSYTVNTQQLTTLSPA